MVNEGNAYDAIDRGAFPGKWKRLHGMRGIPDYIVYSSAKPGRQFFVEVKEIEQFPIIRSKTIKLDLRPAQIPFFKDWPGEKYLLVRWMDTRGWTWFTGKDRFTCLNAEIAGPFKRGCRV